MAEWVAAVAAVTLVAATTLLVAALVSVVRTVRHLRTTLAALEDDARVVVAAAQQAVEDARREVDGLAALVETAGAVGDRMDRTSRLVARTVTSPVVRVMAIGAGTRRAVQRMREHPEGRRR